MGRLCLSVMLAIESIIFGCASLAQASQSRTKRELVKWGRNIQREVSSAGGFDALPPSTAVELFKWFCSVG